MSSTNERLSTHQAQRANPPGDPVRANGSLAALRALPYGGIDDATRNFELPLAVRTAITPAIAVLRWGAVIYGTVFAAPAAFRGDTAPIVTLAVCMFLTTWRTIIPLRLASNSWVDRSVALIDVTLFGLAVGYSGGLDSPFIFCLLAACVVVAFGWGAVPGGASLALAAGAAVTGINLGSTSLSEQTRDQRDLALIAAFLLAVAGATYLRHRLLLAEVQRSALHQQIDTLADANDLLNLLTVTARTLPTSLTAREAVDAAREQLIDTFDPRVIALVIRSDTDDAWTPHLATGCELATVSTDAGLPDVLRNALRHERPVVRDDLTRGESGIVPGMGSGMYTRLTARGTTVAVLGIEHPTIGRYTERDATALSGIADILGLTVDNARWFGRLRRLGADEERTRIARDLHDRLGQWLTYIGIEIERISNHPEAIDDELTRLRADVSSAIDDLRETLRQLRTTASDDRPLAALAPATVERFSERTGTPATCTIDESDEQLPHVIETELLRILQESLNNIERHADARHVDVRWAVNGGNFRLEVRDDGSGFDTSRGSRESAYGLVGMKERADAIGARLTITSSPGQGTTITVVAGTAQTKETSQ
ncbi:MAG: GAF domain-containing sensor histidine kinase [Actinomycetes bacterium]